jgi:hypothetical protein
MTFLEALKTGLVGSGSAGSVVRKEHYEGIDEDAQPGIG